MKIGVVKELSAGERRVALVPDVLPSLTRLGCDVAIQAGAGAAAGFSDDAYRNKGGDVLADRSELFQADVLLGVRWGGASGPEGRDDLPRMRKGQAIIGTSDPLGHPEAAREVAETGVVLFALELLPRITRAQSMDVLSSMATVAGYRAVLLAALELPKMFPLMMTAAGTLAPARVFVIGAGVAGLQAIATARRLGAVVQAYDVRPAVREQCESLGAKFVQLDLETVEAEDPSGYAKQMGERFYARQREVMARVVAESDVVITTAAIPGQPSPQLISAEAVAGMPPGSVIVDLAAERGGNCELTQADQRILAHGVTILGPTNLPSDVPRDASQMYAKNATTFLSHLLEGDQLQIDLNDPITRDTLVARDGQIIHPRIQKLLGMEQQTVSERQEGES